MEKNKMDNIDRIIINSIQDSFPIDTEPYKALTIQLNKKFNLKLTDQETHNRIKNLKSNGFIRRLGVIFNSKPLGYKSTLCVAKVPYDKINAIADMVNTFPQVSHNYLRDNKFNLWFTFSYHCPDELAMFLKEIKKKSGLLDIFDIPSKKIFKIRAVFTIP
jgi:DNA-binding Lrp family transcriptional regulator